MDRKRMKEAVSILLFAGVFLFLGTGTASAHCDTMDGPIIRNALEALDTGKAERVLMWIQKKDEPELMRAFHQAREVRKLNAASKELADRYFLETFVRLHRAGEGAPFTGIKPAGSGKEPAVERADEALETGSVDGLLKFMSEAVAQGVREKFEQVSSLRQHARDSVEAGRAYAAAYVTYVHYVEKIHQDALAGGGSHPMHHAPGQAGATRDAAKPAETHAH